MPEATKKPALLCQGPFFCFNGAFHWSNSTKLANQSHAYKVACHSSARVALGGHKKKEALVKSIPLNVTPSPLPYSATAVVLIKRIGKERVYYAVRVQQRQLAVCASRTGVLPLRASDTISPATPAARAVSWCFSLRFTIIGRCVFGFFCSPSQVPKGHNTVMKEERDDMKAEAPARHHCKITSRTGMYFLQGFSRARGHFSRAGPGRMKARVE